MSVAETDPSDTSSGVLVTGADAVSKESYRKSWNSDGTTSLTEIYKGTETNANTFYNEKTALGTNISSATLDVSKAMGTCEIEYNSDAGTGEQEQDTSPEWSIDIIEVMRPLASHPYWQRRYVPASGYDINQEMARVDLLLAKGEPFVGDGNYDDWTKRYYNLRAAGVNQYPALGLELKKTYTTSSTDSISTSYSNIGKIQTIADIAPPDIVSAAMNAIQQITSYTNADPDTAQFTAGSWEWAKRPSRLVMAGNEDSNTARIEETWWGLDRWSKVIYPGGTWDPPVA